MKFHNTCRQPMYHSQISTKIKELQRERKRVEDHLVLLDKHLETLEAMLTIMQSQDESVLALNSEIYNKHKVKQAIYKTRPCLTLIQYLKNNPERAFSSHELAQMLLDKEKSVVVLSDRYINPIRQILNKLHKKRIVSKRIEWGKNNLLANLVCCISSKWEISSIPNRSFWGLLPYW